MSDDKDLLNIGILKAQTVAKDEIHDVKLSSLKEDFHEFKTEVRTELGWMKKILIGILVTTGASVASPHLSSTTETPDHATTNPSIFDHPESGSRGVQKGSKLRRVDLHRSKKGSAYRENQPASVTGKLTTE